MLPTIFTVGCEHLARLDPGRAIRFFSELLWAEARRLGIAVTNVSISERINVPDGGVDAAVVADGGGAGVLIGGDTCYQVKTGNFKPLQDGAIRRELFGDGTPSRESLSAHLRQCLDKGQRYVLVCTGISLTDQERTAAADGIRSALLEAGYEDPRVGVFSQDQLIGCLIAFPSLCLALNGHANAQFQTLSSWASSDQMRLPFKAGEAQLLAITTLRAGLRANTTSVHVRVRGEPGIGKTRLVLESVSESDLAPLVLYCESPHQLRDGGLLTEILKEDNPFVVLLVVDECSLDAAVTLWDRLKHRGQRIRLVTIFNEYDSVDVTYIDAPPLDVSAIAEILKDYVPATERAERWAELCDGSPRVAHVIGGNLKRNPDDLTKSPGTVDIWGRYIAGSDDPKSPEVKQRHRVLRYLALFKKFGFRGALAAEAKTLAKRLENADPSITWQRFQEIVADLRARRILQGDHTLYITPRLLHIKLWIEWWETYGSDSAFDIESFTNELSPELIEWFYEMFRYGAASEAATSFVKLLLGPTGPFNDGHLLQDERGSAFFLALTDASPESALQRLRATVGTWSREALLAFTSGRRNVIWALEKIAVWRGLFPEAARLMLQLAEAENETWANNATGVFVGFFSTGIGSVAPTEAPPHERFPVLQEALTSNVKQRRVIALKACDLALQTSMLSRLAGAESQGLRMTPILWTPKVWGELFDAYRAVWRALVGQLDSLEADECMTAVDVLLNRTRGLYQIEALSSEVIGTVKDLAAKPYVDRKRIIELVEQVLHHDSKGLAPEQRTEWESLRQVVVGGGFPGRMQRYVAMELLEDHFDDNGQPVDEAGPQVAALAREAYDSPELLWPELVWLMSSGAKNGYRFGYELGTLDTGSTLLPRLLDQQRTRDNVFFFSGYLRAFVERSVDAWEVLLDALAHDSNMRRHIAELTWRAVLTDRAARRILLLVRDGHIEVRSLRMFALGGVIRGISPEVFDEWIGFLLNEGSSEAAHVALDLYHFFYAWKEEANDMPEALTFRLLTAEALFRADGPGSDDDYDWTRIAKRFVQRYPGRIVDLAAVMLEHLGVDGTIIGRFNSPTLEILRMAGERYPREVWARIEGYLGPPLDSRAYAIKDWLRDGGITLFPSDAVVAWIEADPDKRAWYAASFVPKVFPGSDSSLSARELLIRYGARRDVRNNLGANFATEGWTGPASRHYEAKRQQLLEARASEVEPSVQSWLDDYLSALEARRDQARIEEEREDF